MINSRYSPTTTTTNSAMLNINFATFFILLPLQ
nr:MAG TPA: hypothetical protein [Caudoviricetes sp.]